MRHVPDHHAYVVEYVQPYTFMLVLKVRMDELVCD